MIISIIAALGKNRELGGDNRLLWRLPLDLANFKRLTSHHHILMGRKTYDSIGRPLPQRKNIVLSRSSQGRLDDHENIFWLQSFREAIKLAKKNQETELFVIGGAELYRQALPFASRFYLTEVNTAPIEADTFFPEFHDFNWTSGKQELHSQTDSTPSWSFRILEKKPDIFHN